MVVVIHSVTRFQEKELFCYLTRSHSSSVVTFPPVTMTTTLLPGNKSGILSDCKAAKAAAPEGSTTRPAW